MTHHIWYHSPCNDGLGAAYAAWVALGEDGMRYVPVAYGDPLPEIEPEDEVTLLDFTAPRADLLRLAQVAGRITILDHHASAARALDGLAEEGLATEGACEIRVHFDMNHASAILAWQHFHPDIPAALVLRLIEDRDLWRFQDPDSKPLHYALATERDFRNLDLFRSSHWALTQAITRGRAILTYLEGEWDAIASRAAVTTPRNGGDQGPFLATVCPCPSSWFSDVGHLLLTQHSEIQVAVLYNDYPASGYTTVSLRSRPGGLDVSRLAAAQGGGGHPQAAGFLQPLANPLYGLFLPAAPTGAPA